MNFGPQWLKTGPEILPILTILFCPSEVTTLWRDRNVCIIIIIIIIIIAHPLCGINVAPHSNSK